jgi:hypothetical protein
MKKIIISVATLIALSTSSLSFAWGHDERWEHHGGFRGHGFVESVVRAPFIVAGAALGAAGAIAYNAIPGPYYAPPRTYYEQPRTYYAPQPYVVQPQVIMQAPVVMPPQPYPYRPYY